ncbi:DUF4184 family protein [Streptomyces sp. NPDC093085]|uniref:DUF4184 family protein n=1 Tax=Streptomyces sp. NPDC093085 TaxID=3155068 RepID=UPI00341BC210
MPFTPAHPAAVLPLLRHPFSPAALVCGAIAPDVPYFLAGAGIPVSAQSWYEPFLNATYSHTLPGLTVALPSALALLVLYGVVRRPVAALLPTHPSPARTASHPAVWVLLSALTGIATHLVWDSFTHADGYVVEHAAVLRTQVAGSLTLARLIQHLSTVGGLAAVAIHLWHRRPRTPRTPRTPATTPSSTTAPAPFPALPRPARRAAVATLTTATLIGAVTGAAATLEDSRGGAAHPEQVPLRDLAEATAATALTSAGAALAAALALYAAAWWSYTALRRTTPST